MYLFIKKKSFYDFNKKHLINNLKSNINFAYYYIIKFKTHL